MHTHLVLLASNDVCVWEDNLEAPTVFRCALLFTLTRDATWRHAAVPARDCLPSIEIRERADDYAASVTKQTTGGHVWDAARVLLEYVESQSASAPPFASRRVVELGAGTGFLSMTLAAR